MAHTGRARIAAAIGAIALSAGIVVACSDDNDYRNCPDWECGDGLFLVPMIIPAYGVYGQPGYHTSITIQPGAPNYRPTYQGKPPNFTPPPGAKVNPPGAKPPPNYKPPSGSTLTVQKAPKPSGNTMPGGSGGGSSQKPGGNQTVQKAPSGGSSRSGSSGGSRSGSSGKR